MVPRDTALESACDSICSKHDSVRKLSSEGCGYLVFISVDKGGDVDGLVGGDFGCLSGQRGHGTPQPSGVLAVR